MIDTSILEKLCKTPQGWQARCPACASEGSDKSGNHLSILADGRFNCVKYSGDKDHNKTILALASGEIPEGFYVPPQPKIEMPQEWPITILDGLIKEYSYWVKRGISVETCEKFQVGVAKKGQMHGRSVLPIFNIDHTRIMGFTGRKMVETYNGPRWKHLGDKKTWLYTGQLYVPKKMARVVLVESPVCIMRLSMEKIDDTFCLFGIKMTSAIMSYLIQYNPDEILIATNNEIENNSIGNLAAEDIRNKLLNFFSANKVKIALPIAKDFGDQTEEQMKEWKSKWSI